MENNLNHYSNVTWRFIPPHTQNAYMNVALEDVCIDAVANGESAPIIRFYNWEPSAVIIGYFQQLEAEVNLPACRKDGVDVVRRRTGGGGIYQDVHGGLTYSVVAPEHFFPREIIPSYQHVADWIISGLGELNIPAQFAPINDIQVGGKKISGNAQTRRKGVALIHGTLLFDVDPEKMFTYLRVPDEKIRDKVIASVKERVIGMKHFGVGTREEGYAALKKAFLRGKDFTETDLTSDELMRAEELVEEKYSQPQWIAQR